MTTIATEIQLTPGWSDNAAFVEGAATASKLVLVLAGGEADEAALIALADRVKPTEWLGLRAADALSSEWLCMAVKLGELCRNRGIAFLLDFVVPADADVTGFRLGRDGSLKTLVAGTKQAKDAHLSTRWLVPLAPPLVYKLDGLASLAAEQNAEPLFILSALVSGTHLPLTGDDRLFAWDFIAYRILGEEIGGLTAVRIAYYRALESWLRGESDTAPAFAADALLPAGNGPLGKQRPDRLKEIGADLADVASAGLLGHGLATISPGALQGPDPQIPFALLIGAYGGEHIGDAAILGGVLHRIHARHGTNRAILMTQRPAHTRHLVKMLETPVTVEVQEYTMPNIRQAARKVNGLVFAGGPLTDLPKQLVRHLVAASQIKRAKKPFIMEGIGPGTFPRKPSEVTARRLVLMADRISIRTKADASQAIIRGRQVEVGHDPAFDYLATRGPVLSRLPAFEPPQIDQLLAGTEGRPVIGLNIRPIGHLYTPDAPGRDKLTYTQEVEQNFEAQFAKGLLQFTQGHEPKPCFIFFPMNAIQFGMSDLRSAHRILRHMGPDVDFRLWEADSSLDGVVALIRRLDAVVSMRFHATIFALSQNCPVAGIDYRIGKRDKVAAVLSDAGREDDCCRIDQLTADWLSAKLSQLLTR